MSAYEWFQVFATIIGAVISVTVYFNKALAEQREAFNRELLAERIAREKVAEDLAAYKLRVTTEHPNYERMNEMMQALTRSMDELKHDVRAIFERINNGTRVPH